MNIVKNYSYVIPPLGQIDLIAVESEAILYDLYQVSDDVLLLGHAFRNHCPYTQHNDIMSEDQIENLKLYIIYHKVP